MYFSLEETGKVKEFHKKDLLITLYLRYFLLSQLQAISGSLADSNQLSYTSIADSAENIFQAIGTYLGDGAHMGLSVTLTDGGYDVTMLKAINDAIKTVKSCQELKMVAIQGKHLDKMIVDLLNGLKS